MTTTTQQRYDWKDEQEIKQQEFADGYHVERDRRTPERDGSDDALTHDQNEGNPNATTLYGGRHADGYDPNERLPDCERWATKGTSSPPCGRGTRGWIPTARHAAVGRTVTRPTN
ncbi:hypothetical protein ACFQL4_25985 [Halosimplex aquaticum]